MIPLVQLSCTGERRARHTPLPPPLVSDTAPSPFSPHPSKGQHLSFEPTHPLFCPSSPLVSDPAPSPPLPLRHRGVINQGFVPRTAHHTCTVRATGLRSVPPGYRKRPWIFTWPIQPRSQGSRRWPGPAWPGTFSANLQWTSGLAAESSYSPYCW